MSEKFILRSRKPKYEIPLQSVGETVWKRLKAFNPNQTCIIDARNETKLSVGELLTQANSIAIALLKRGITKSDRFCCFSVNTIPYVVLQFAAYFLGITLVPLSPTFTVFEIKKEIQNSGSTVIFTSAKNAHNFDVILKDFEENVEKAKIKLVVVFDGIHGEYLPFKQLLEEGENQCLDRIPYFKVDPKIDYFLLIFSSGTTGLPKCAILSHLMFNANLTEALNLKISDHLIVSGHNPFGHVSGSLSLPVFVSLGATFVIYGEYDEELILQSVEKYKINFMLLFPNLARKLIEGEFVDKYDLSSLKAVQTGGAHFPKHVAQDIVNKYNLKFKEIYGLTEYTCVTEGFPLFDFNDPKISQFIPGNAGHVSPNTQLKFIDLTTGQSLGPNIDGELCVRGPKMFLGYLNNIKATNDTIDSEGWLHTGDIGHYDQNEGLFITDRLKEMIKVGVVAISPTEIEQFLLTHESVAEVTVVGVKHETETQWPRAYVKVKEGKSVTEEELKKYVSETLAQTKQLRAGVVFVDKIERTNIGKVDRKYYKTLVSNEVIKK